jgi:2,4-dienoyl-CoA reductase-like NADH-dependent reductase (Old Yellow Enzyme family)
MTTWSGNADGTNSDAEFDYYKARAAGVGMLITGTTFVAPNGQGFAQQFAGYDDRFISNLSKLAKTIQSQGAKAVLQIFHAGRLSSPELSGNDVVAPSAVVANRGGAMPRALREDEIPALVDAFGATVERAIEAGFDGVEIHGANGYLIQQFFSPHANTRDDDWGGTREKRARFPLAVADRVLETVKAKAPKDFIVGYRFSPEETGETGIALEDTLYLIDKLADKPFSYLHISLKQYDLTPERDPKDRVAMGAACHRALRDRVPLIGVGSVKTAEDVAGAFELGYDLVAIGRALIADPDFVQKVRDGDEPIHKVRNDYAKRHIPHDLYVRLKAAWKDLVEG